LSAREPGDREVRVPRSASGFFREATAAAAAATKADERLTPRGAGSVSRRLERRETQENRRQLPPGEAASRSYEVRLARPVAWARLEPLAVAITCYTCAVQWAHPQRPMARKSGVLEHLSEVEGQRRLEHLEQPQRNGQQQQKKNYIYEHVDCCKRSPPSWSMHDWCCGAARAMEQAERACRRVGSRLSDGTAASGEDQLSGRGSATMEAFAWPQHRGCRRSADDRERFLFRFSRHHVFVFFFGVHEWECPLPACQAARRPGPSSGSSVLPCPVLRAELVPV
jgi:hypothetical protein